MLPLTHLTSLGRAALRLALCLAPLAPLVALAAVPMAVVACGDQSSNAAPIIDSVDAPPVVTEQNGTYAIPITMLFHDNDGEAITRVHYRLPPNIDGIVDVPAPNPNVESAQVTIVVKAADLDGTPARDVAVKNEGDDPRAAQAEAQAQDDRDHGRGKDRNRARALELRIVDGRGAESLPLSRTVTLD
jgi:hypothetical protein